MGFNPKQELALDNLRYKFEAYGYAVVSDPIEGMEELFLDELRNAASKIDATVVWLRSRFGYRGKSMRLLADLHRALPSPAFGVELW
jgi:hypothetical protein